MMLKKVNAKQQESQVQKRGKNTFVFSSDLDSQAETNDSHQKHLTSPKKQNKQELRHPTQHGETQLKMGKPNKLTVTFKKTQPKNHQKYGYPRLGAVPLRHCRCLAKGCNGSPGDFYPPFRKQNISYERQRCKCI